jgi:hypothetical protein
MTAGKQIIFYGYKAGDEGESPLLLEEVTLVANPRTLRAVARFLQHTADLMEEHGDMFGHEHLSDFDQEMVDQPAFIISK